MLRARIAWCTIAAFVCGIVPSIAPANAAPKKLLDYHAYSAWRQIRDVRLSRDGHRLAYALVPAEADGELIVRDLGGSATFRAARGRAPQFTADGRFVVYRIAPPIADVKAADKAGKSADQRPKDGLGIADVSDVASARATTVERVRSFALARDGATLAFLYEPSPSPGPSASASPRAVVSASPSASPSAGPSRAAGSRSVAFAASRRVAVAVRVARAESAGKGRAGVARDPAARRRRSAREHQERRGVRRQRRRHARGVCRPNESRRERARARGRDRCRSHARARQRASHRACALARRCAAGVSQRPRRLRRRREEAGERPLTVPADGGRHANRRRDRSARSVDRRRCAAHVRERRAHARVRGRRQAARGVDCRRPDAAPVLRAGARRSGLLVLARRKAADAAAPRSRGQDERRVPRALRPRRAPLHPARRRRGPRRDAREGRAVRARRQQRPVRKARDLRRQLLRRLPRRRRDRRAHAARAQGEERCAAALA